MQTAELLDRYEYTLKCQMQEIDRLRAELQRRDEEPPSYSPGSTAIAMR